MTDENHQTKNNGTAKPDVPPAKEPIEQEPCETQDPNDQKDEAQDDPAQATGRKHFGRLRRLKSSVGAKLEKPRSILRKKYERHWLGTWMVFWFALWTGVYSICLAFPQGPVKDWASAAVALIVAIFGVWKHGSKDKDEACKYSKEKVEATTQYGIAILAVIILLVDPSQPPQA